MLNIRTQAVGLGYDIPGVKLHNRISCSIGHVSLNC